jgi:hypothetical protein
LRQKSPQKESADFLPLRLSLPANQRQFKVFDNATRFAY